MAGGAVDVRLGFAVEIQRFRPLPTLLLLVIFLGLVWCLVSVGELAGAANPNLRRRFLLALAAGLLAGLGMLTRYSFGWVMVPVVIYLVTFGGTRRTGLSVGAFLAFAAAVTPWLVRNFAVSGTLFGTAGYAVMEGTGAFPGTKLMQSLNPDLVDANYFLATIYPAKLLVNLRAIFQDELFHWSGGWICILFLAGLLLGLRNTLARRLRYFTMLCLGVFILVAALGRTQWTLISPEMNTENPLVLLTPLVAIFGVAFFLTLLNQMNLPSFQARLAVVGLVAVLMCQPLIMTLLPPRISPIAYPPYYPPGNPKNRRLDAPG